AVPLVDVDQPGVDLPVAVRRLGDARAGPRGVEELRDPVRGAARVLRVRVPPALLAPEVLEAAELAAAPAELAQRVVLVRARGSGRGRRITLAPAGGQLLQGRDVVGDVVAGHPRGRARGDTQLMSDAHRVDLRGIGGRAAGGEDVDHDGAGGGHGEVEGRTAA